MSLTKSNYCCYKHESNLTTNRSWYHRSQYDFTSLRLHKAHFIENPSPFCFYITITIRSLFVIVSHYYKSSRFILLGQLVLYVFGVCTTCYSTIAQNCSSMRKHTGEKTHTNKNKTVKSIPYLHTSVGYTSRFVLSGLF